MDSEVKEETEVWTDKERVDETWRQYHESLGGPQIKLSDLDPKIIELIAERIMEKEEMEKMLKEELEWLARNPEYSW